MKKSILLEFLILLLSVFCSITSLVFFCNSKPNENLTFKVFEINIETSISMMLFLFWLISIFTINSIRQLKIKYKNQASNLVLFIVSGLLIYFTIRQLSSSLRLNKAYFSEQNKGIVDINKTLILFWTFLILLLLTEIIITATTIKSIKQK